MNLIHDFHPQDPLIIEQSHTPINQYLTLERTLISQTHRHFSKPNDHHICSTDIGRGNAYTSNTENKNTFPAPTVTHFLSSIYSSPPVWKVHVNLLDPWTLPKRKNQRIQIHNTLIISTITSVLNPLKIGMKDIESISFTTPWSRIHSCQFTFLHPKAI